MFTYGTVYMDTVSFTRRLSRPLLKPGRFENAVSDFFKLNTNIFKATEAKV